MADADPTEEEPRDPNEEDLDRLLDFLLGFASQQLGEEGEFFPFAAALTVAGEVEPVTVQLEEELPSSETVVAQLVEALRARVDAGELRASGICVNATVSLEGEDADGTDAALVHLEHVEGDPVDVVLPYELHGDHIHGGELIAAPGETRVFGEREG